MERKLNSLYYPGLLKGKTKYFIVVLLLAVNLSYTQNHGIDSLVNVLKKEKDDTNKVNKLNDLAYSLSNTVPDSTISIAQLANALSAKLDWIKGEINACNIVGIAYWRKGDYPKALDYDIKALKMAEELGNKQLQEYNLCNIGIVYNDQGDYPKALDYDMKALKMAEEVGNKQAQASNLSNIGLIYLNQSDYPKALEYETKALNMAEEIGDKETQATNLNNLGITYKRQSDYAKALEYYLKAWNLANETGNKQLQAMNLSNIGNAYYEQAGMTQYRLKIRGRDSLYKKALDFDLEAWKMAQEMGSTQGQAITIGNIGSVYTKTGKFIEAEEYLKEAIALDSSIGDQNHLMLYEERISQLYDTIGRSKQALAYYKKAVVLKDTLFNIERNKALTRKELTYQYEKKQAAEKAEQDKKDVVAEQEKNKQKIIRDSFIIGFALMIALTFFIFRGYRQKQKANVIITQQKELVEKQKEEVEKQKDEVEKQKTLVEHQKALVEEKNKDILDSITYAKRLQDAILLPMKMVKQFLPESFVMYKPKDIVAGDFYWMERVEENILIAAADCTGHGVPGALVSVVCSNALNRTVKEFKIKETGKILDKVRELVLETFEKSEGNIQDGMDISLCCINTKTNEVQWSGAYNSLWYVHNGMISEVAADKQPIGKVDKPAPFNTHNLNLVNGDILYLFTDGYADQFGGPKGKKFKYKQMQEFILANATCPMEEQSMKLEQALEEWKGGLEQVDDVLIIGVRL
jgi:tetratricopeptide (TPR) repeat protein